MRKNKIYTLNPADVPKPIGPEKPKPNLEPDSIPQTKIPFERPKDIDPTQIPKIIVSELSKNILPDQKEKDQQHESPETVETNNSNLFACNTPVHPWAEKTMFWHIYPLGFTDAFVYSRDASDRYMHLGVEPVQHRFHRLTNWLDYVRELGLNGIILNPIFQSYTHGYDTTDYMKIDTRLGDEKDFEEFITEAHKRGIRVILDGVFNHVGTRFQKYLDAREGDVNALKWFIVEDWSKKNDTSNSADANDDGDTADGTSNADTSNAGAGNADTGNAGANNAGANNNTPANVEKVHVPYELSIKGMPNMALKTFEGHQDLIELNHNSQEVIDYVTDVMNYWLDKGADGWRLDAAYATDPHFWNIVLKRVREKHPDVWIMAEIIHGDYVGYIKNATYNSLTEYEIWHASWQTLKNKDFYDINWSISRLNRFSTEFVPQTFIGNHDVTRVASYVNNDELNEMTPLFLFTLAGIPSVYSGDEQGYKALKLEQFAGDDAIRLPFPETPPDVNKFTGFTKRTYDVYKKLIDFRRHNSWLTRCFSLPVYIESTFYVYNSISQNENKSILVFCNCSNEYKVLNDETLKKVNEIIKQYNLKNIFYKQNLAGGMLKSSFSGDINDVKDFKTKNAFAYEEDSPANIKSFELSPNSWAVIY